MHTSLDAKMMARALRQGLAERHVKLSHADCLELVARQYDFASWNILAAKIAAATVPELQMPEGWHPGGQGAPGLYRMGLDPDHLGAVRISSTQDQAATAGEQFGTLMQSIVADRYRGGKLRLTAELRGELVGLGAIWMRIDPLEGRFLRFDNLMTRKSGGALQGSFAWTERSIVLDVPAEAASVHYGVLMKGAGDLWARRFSLEVADDDATTTAVPVLLSQPTNLDFSPDARPGA